MKKSSHQIKATIEVTPAEAWEVIGAVGGVDKWLTPITACRVEGNKRFCSTEQGEFSEDILNVDHQTRVLEYAIPQQHMIPVEDIRGTMRVLPTGKNQATVEWSWTFEVAEEREAEALEILSMVGQMGINGIETLVRETRHQNIAS